MNMWMLTAIILGILIIGGIAVAALTTDQESTATAEKTSCSSCGNSCTAENNCGLSTCGAVNGKTCGCGR